MFYKITNLHENHHGFQYCDGLNILQETFSESCDDCCQGGLYFTDIKNIFKFVGFGYWVREVELPVNDPLFCMVKLVDKWRANRIILGKKIELWQVSTIIHLMEMGANLIYNIEFVFRCASKNACVPVMQYLISLGVDVTCYENYAVRMACADGDLNTVKLLVDVGANVCDRDHLAIQWASENGHLEVVTYLANKSNININNNYCFRLASRNGHLPLVRYFVENGVKINCVDNYAMNWACRKGHLDIVKFLIQSGADTKDAIKCAMKKNQIHVIQYLEKTCKATINN